MHYKKWLKVERGAMQTKTITKHRRTALKFKLWANREIWKGSWDCKFMKWQ